MRSVFLLCEPQRLPSAQCTIGMEREPQRLRMACAAALPSERTPSGRVCMCIASTGTPTASTHSPTASLSDGYRHNVPPAWSVSLSGYGWHVLRLYTMTARTDPHRARCGSMLCMRVHTHHRERQTASAATIGTMYHRHELRPPQRLRMARAAALPSERTPSGRVCRCIASREISPRAPLYSA